MTATIPVTRRTFFAALTLASMCRAGTAVAQADGLRIRAVAADTSAIAATGGGTVAIALQGLLVSQLSKVFADRLVPGDRSAPVLVARMRSVFLAPYAGGIGIDHFGQQDTIEGDGVVVEKGRALSSTHILTELTPAYSGAYYTPGIDHIRLDALAYQFAYWLRREMHG